MTEVILSGLAIIISILSFLNSRSARKKASKVSDLEIKHKYLEELYEVRTKFNHLLLKTEQQISILSNTKNLFTLISTLMSKLNSEYKTDGVDIPEGFLQTEKKSRQSFEMVLKHEEEKKGYYKRLQTIEKKLDQFSSIDNPEDKEFTDLHEIKTNTQMIINEVERDIMEINESYNEMLESYMDLNEEIQSILEES